MINLEKDFDDVKAGRADAESQEGDGGDEGEAGAGGAGAAHGAGGALQGAGGGGGALNTGENPESISESADPVHFVFAQMEEAAVEKLTTEMDEAYGKRRWWRQECGPNAEGKAPATEDRTPVCRICGGDGLLEIQSGPYFRPCDACGNGRQVTLGLADDVARPPSQQRLVGHSE